MLNRINQYKLDTFVKDYPEDDLMPFDQKNYDFFEEFFGITRQFKGEVFYYPENNIFLGRECHNSIVATINKVIYKIFFCFHNDNEDEFFTLRNIIFNYFTKYMTQELLNNPEFYENEDVRVLFWKFDWGNLILQIEGYDISYIITSQLVKHARPLGFFRKFYDLIKKGGR